MDATNSSSVNSIQEIAVLFQQEVTRLKLDGHALLPEEQKHLETMRQSLASLSELAASASASDTKEQDNEGPLLREGRYLAANAQFQAEVRLDTCQSGIVSMDLFLGSGSSRTYLASLRSNPGEEIKRGQRLIDVIGEDEDGKQAAGTVEIITLSETQATIKITLRRGLTSLPVNFPIILSGNWMSPYFRTIGLEIDIESGVPSLPSIKLDERTVTLESCFGEAGLEIIQMGRRDSIPKPNQGWDAAQLHGLMVQFADESIRQKSWLLNLLVLSAAKDTKSGKKDLNLNGIMFDTGRLDENGLPRQGAAVFTEPMHSHRAGSDQKLIQTTIHELGHALNLAHRFERTVGRADSTSCMNYDWRYLGGNREDQFWRDFRFGFDPDEVRFLRHGSRSALIPGGSEFHTINYWSDGTGGYEPYLPEEQIPGLELSLRPPVGGNLFAFAQPILLTIALKNISGRTLNIPFQVLDPKSGFLEIIVQRSGFPTRNSSQEKFTFSPLIHRCWDLQALQANFVLHNSSLVNNLNLTFGATGFTFAEPGTYEITAILSIVDKVRNIDQIVRSNPMRIRVAYPKTREEENEIIDFFDKDVGYFLALGGSDILPKASDTLEEICDKRKKGSSHIQDPLVANIIRANAINYSRDFIIYKEGKFSTRSANPDKAVKLLSQLVDPSARKFFDPATLEGNAKLINQLKNK